MNKLILIGNGFDLAHGLKTRYSDFILWYLSNVWASLIAKSFYEDDLVVIRPTRPFDGNAKIQSAEDIMMEIRKWSMKVNFKHQFFEHIIAGNLGSNWVDIECEYYFFLLVCYKPLENLGIERNQAVNAQVKKLNEGFDLIKKKLVEYLGTINCEEPALSDEIRVHLFNGMTDIKNRNSQWRNGIREEVMILNFNYTSTIERYISPEVSDVCKINYIHGKLADCHNPIIFGYGDEMDLYYEKIERLNDNEFLKNIKSFGYFKTQNYRDFMRFIDAIHFEVYIMGHSCGLSDRILLNSIFEHHNCVKIQIHYHERSKGDDDFVEKTHEISRHFKASGKSNMRKKIVPHSKCKPLITYTS